MLTDGASHVALVVRNAPTNAGDIRGEGSIPGLGRSPGEGNDNPLQYSCLENSMDRGAWRVVVLGVAKSWTRLSDFTSLDPEVCSSLLNVGEGKKRKEKAHRSKQNEGECEHCSVHFILRRDGVFCIPGT